ncbi:unnamed protein product, partial [Prorocentrum cordatum]
NPACWEGPFTHETCCAPPGVGNPDCWGGLHTYESCCEMEEVPLFTNAGDLNQDAGGPQVSRFLATQGGICDGASVPAGCLVHAEERDWKELFEFHSLSQFTSVRGEPINVSELARRMEHDDQCPYAPFVRLQGLAWIEQRFGEEAAAQAYRRDWHRLGTAGGGDCFVEHLLNRASFAHYPLLYDTEPTFPCPPGRMTCYFACFFLMRRSHPMLQVC